MIDEPRRHPDADLDPELVAAYLDGKLFDEERRVVEQAMKDRPELARQLEIDPSSAHRVRERRDPLARLGPRDGGTRATDPDGPRARQARHPPLAAPNRAATLTADAPSAP